MKILQSEKKEKGLVEVLIEVTPEQYDTAAGKAFIKNRNRVSVPGFRKGKAPRRMVEKMYGADIFMNDSLEILYPDLIKIVVETDEYKIVDQPQITDIDFENHEGGLGIKLSFTVYPEVKIGEYKGLSAPKDSCDISDEVIDSEIEVVRARNARIESVERPAADGDLAIIDFEGFLEGEPFDGGKGENYELELGSNTFIPGFEEKVVGMKIGEEREIDLVFPDEYAEELAGKAVVFKVKLNEVKEKQLPDIDDEFAMDVSEFDTIAEYKADIRERLEKEAKTRVDEAFESALMEKLVDGMDVEVPDAMVEERMDFAMRSFTRQLSAYNMEPAQYLQMMGLTPEEFKENSRANSERQVKVSLALEKIAELENIEISDEDIENEYKKVAEEVNQDIEEIKKSVDKEAIVNDLKLRAASKLVIDSAKAEKPKPKAEDSPKTATKKTAPKKTASKKTEPKKATTKKAATPKTVTKKPKEKQDDKKGDDA